MSTCLRRREFIAALGAAAVWPLAARAQQGNRVRRIGWFRGGDLNAPVAKLQLSAFTQALADLGWTDGRNKGEAVRLRPSRCCHSIEQSGYAVPSARSLC